LISALLQLPQQFLADISILKNLHSGRKLARLFKIAESLGPLSDLLMMLWFGVRVFLYGANPGSAPDPVKRLINELVVRFCR
jgi:hypothetical protein